MKKLAFVSLAAAAVLAALAACSSSSSNGGSGTGACSGNGSSSAESAQCSSCMQSKCSSQESAAQSACVDAYNCECSCAKGDLNCQQACESKITPACHSAGDDVETCQNANCKTECTVTVTGGGQDSGTTLTGSCATLSACCSTLPSQEQAGCTAAANTSYDQACQQVLAGFQDAGICH